MNLSFVAVCAIDNLKNNKFETLYKEYKKSNFYKTLKKFQFTNRPIPKDSHAIKSEIKNLLNTNEIKKFYENAYCFLKTKSNY